MLDHRLSKRLIKFYSIVPLGTKCGGEYERNTSIYCSIRDNTTVGMIVFLPIYFPYGKFKQSLSLCSKIYYPDKSLFRHGVTYQFGQIPFNFVFRIFVIR